MDRPETRYAWNGEVALAYQIVGDGPTDVVYLQGYCSNIDMSWESPHLARFLRGLAALGRLIVMDRRGWGCSDRFSPSDVPPFETLTDDLIAVLDAAGSERALVLASWECGALAVLFAATHPERTHALVLVDAFPAYTATEGTPWLPDEDLWMVWLREIHDEWGTPAWLEGEMDDLAEREWFTRYERASITPGSAVAEERRYMTTDVSRILPSIQVPTLVLSDPTLAARTERGPRQAAVGRGRSLSSAENGRFLADRIPGARLVEITAPPDQVYKLHWYGRAEPILREVERFLVDVREEEASFDRVLATVLFTDIVGSTGKSAELGDRAWRRLVQDHHATVRTLLARYRGREVDTAGDGFFATFDGPARAARCGMAIVEAVEHLGIQVRAGLHTGEVETIDAKVGGIAVNIGARVGALARPGEVLVSQTVKDLVAGSGLVFEDAGEHELKGVPDRWRLYRVVG
jgi:class 3 adenylate cyclase